LLNPKEKQDMHITWKDSTFHRRREVSENQDNHYRSAIELVFAWVARLDRQQANLKG